MIKVICDVCGGEKVMKTDDLVALEVTPSIQIPCHIAEEDKSGGYSDSEGNQVSGRKVSFILCRKCDNEVHQAAFDKIKNLRVLKARKQTEGG